MSHSIKRREFLALAVAASGMAVSVSVHADSAQPILPSVQPTTPEGIALVSEAYATVGYPISPVVADEVRKKLSGYPGGFTAARAFVLPNSVSPSMGHSAFLDLKRPAPPKVKSNHAPTPASTPPGNQGVPSSNDVKPLPVPPGTYQN